MLGNQNWEKEKWESHPGKSKELWTDSRKLEKKQVAKNITATTTICQEVCEIVNYAANVVVVFLFFKNGETSS